MMVKPNLPIATKGSCWLTSERENPPSISAGV